eukprot:TRINITY_DN1846_c0_g1_i4.p1 TRINITY_DN1846_c0_g1~~TRINITY_DN1846_c0_g1_i4.p1  ORF type:complete len:316 (-),score=63.70 TRINITY_DN1846_c0_g1_i4:240-1187(-)
MPQMTPGDWICSACGDHQFARNQACRKCGAGKPGGGGGAGGSNMLAQAQALVEMMSQGGGAGAGIQQMMAMAAKSLGGAGYAGGGGFGKGSGGKGAANANVEQGDWFCASCGDHQFARNAACRKCGAPKSDTAEDAPGGFNMAALSAPSFGGGGGGAQPAMPGDWNCPACGDHQFARNSVCRKCGSPKDGAGGAGAFGGGGGGGAAALMASVMAAMGGGKGALGGKGKGGKGQMVEGDWICPSCGDHQFARNQACRKCGAAKDDGAVLQQHSNAKLLPGDWICPGCGDHQFQRNMQCRKCGMDKPASASERASPY